MWSPRIEIDRPAEDSLSQHVWIFTLVDNMVVLNTYQYRIRETRRHKFKVLKVYNRLHHRRFDNFAISEEDVPTPEDVFNEALEQVRSQLAVGLWQRDFGRS